MSLHIAVQGSGPIPVVMIHGWAMHGGIFAPLVAALAERCTLYVVDLPGHGHSRESTTALEARVCAEAIASATPPAIWLGWSMGGLIALQAASELKQVRGLAMLCATPKFVRDDSWPYGNDAGLVRQLADDLHTDYHATLERFFALEAMGSADPRAELRRLREDAFSRGEPDARVLQEGIRLLETTDMRGLLPGLTMPSAWIAGRRDRLVTAGAMAWSAEQCGGDADVIAHAGHAPFIGHTDAVLRSLEPLLDLFP